MLFLKYLIFLVILYYTIRTVRNMVRAIAPPHERSRLRERNEGPRPTTGYRPGRPDVEDARWRDIS